MKDEEKYEFDLANPDQWTKMPRPHMDETFVTETNRIGGMNKHGEPRFKWVWGMSEEVYVDMLEDAKLYPSGWYLKYQLCMTPPRLLGYVYRDITGKEVMVDSEGDVPDGLLCGPKYSRPEQVGTPRWYLEEWRDEGDLNGVFDRSGYYFHRMIVRDDLPENEITYLKPYREPNTKDLEILVGYVQLTASLTEDDIKKGVEKDREREAEISAKLKAETREEMAETITEIITDIPRENLPEPSRVDVARAWKQLETKI